jgi:hypothetical protein
MRNSSAAVRRVRGKRRYARRPRGADLRVTVGTNRRGLGYVGRRLQRRDEDFQRALDGAQVVGGDVGEDVGQALATGGPEAVDEVSAFGRELRDDTAAVIGITPSFEMAAALQAG